ncbi:MAG: peptidase S10 [Candidatus Eremiobacteraeota bacterium]|nr:peptidase S10 [Candidatus Eremiobacteraeota bacterium]
MQTMRYKTPHRLLHSLGRLVLNWRHLSLSLALAAGCAAPALAASAPTPSPSPSVIHLPNAPDAVTQHTIALDGKSYAYTARAGTITLRTQDDQPTARVFYTAYTVNDGGAPGTRPITFLYNGGPGSSTMWLHMGSFAPVRVETANGTITGPAPYRIVPNSYSLLDKSDLIFIDMPDSGFGRIIGVGKPKDFFGVDQDVKAFGQFIQRYITKFGRWNSPKFLYGESYGTTRSAALVDYLQNAGISMNGVVLQSTILNFGVDQSDIGGNDWQYILDLPTETATAWYHHALPSAPASLQALLPTVQTFAMGEYADALAKGSNLSRSEYDDVVAKLHQYSGVSTQFIRNSNLRFPYSRFENQLFRNTGKMVGRLDGRFQTYTTDRLNDQPPWDPTDAAIDSPFTTTINQYLREDLKYTTSLPYRANIYGIIYQNGSSWDFKHRGNPTTNVVPDLSEAMTYNPKLQIFAANGYYDFATPYFETVYTLDHLRIEPSLRKNITYGFYESGHMIYLEPQALKQLHYDLERWYAGALGSNP